MAKSKDKSKSNPDSNPEPSAAAAAEVAPGQRMPVWAKLLLTFFVVGSGGVVVTLAMGAAVLADWRTNMHNPARMPEVAKQTAILENPLPAGFVYDTALPCFVIISHPTTKDEFALLKLPNPNEGSAKAIAQVTAEHGSPINGSPLTAIKEQGTLEAGGQQMYYLTGDSLDRQGRKVKAMVAVAVPKGKAESIMLVAFSQGESFDMATAKQFLTCIKGF